MINIELAQKLNDAKEKVLFAWGRGYPNAVYGIVEDVEIVFSDKGREVGLIIHLPHNLEKLSFLHSHKGPTDVRSERVASVLFFTVDATLRELYKDDIQYQQRKG